MFRTVLVMAAAAFAIAGPWALAQSSHPRGPDGLTWCSAKELYQECSVDEQKEHIWQLVDPLPHMTRVQHAGYLHEENGGVMRRAFHAKAHGCYKATFHVTADEKESMVGPLFKQTGAHLPAYVRFSSGHPFVGGDIGPDFRGLAVKVIGVPGAKLRQKDAVTQDFTALTVQTLPVPDADGFMDFVKKTLPPSSRWDLAAYMIKAPMAVKEWLLDNLIRAPLSLRTETFWSVTPYKFGPKAMKFHFEPCEGTLPGSLFRSFSATKFRDDLEFTRKITEVCYDMWVRVQENLDASIEDHTELWRFWATDDYKVGTLTIPRQVEPNAAEEAYCESLQFSPMNSAPEYAPLGSVNRLRNKAYENSAKGRHAVPEPVR